MTNFNIIDAPTGVGKTTALIDKVKREASPFSNKRFLIVTPFLSEVQRICKETGFREPKSLGCIKRNSLKILLATGENICCTHSLYAILESETIALISSGIYRYTLIIDEEPATVQCIVGKKIIGDDISRLKMLAPKDYKYAKDNGIICIDDITKHITWNENSDYSKDVTNTGCWETTLKPWLATFDLYSINNNQSIIAVVKASLWENFSEIWVASYRVKNSYLSAYCKFNKFDMTYYHIKDNKIVAGYKDLKPIDLKRLKVCVNPSYVYGKPNGNSRPLSFSWCEKHLIDKITKEITTIGKDLQGHFRSFLRYPAGNQGSKRLIWTCYKSTAKTLSGKEVSVKRWLAYNTRATNDYMDCTVVGFLCDRYPNINVDNFFKQQGITLDKDYMALSDLIQFVWRSAIRDKDNKEQVHVFIPSYRMRMLFLKWIGNTI